MKVDYLIATKEKITGVFRAKKHFTEMKGAMT